MPLYEYRCKDCGRAFEELVGKSVPDSTPLCPSCGSENCERQFSTFAMAAGKSRSDTVCRHADKCAGSGYT